MTTISSTRENPRCAFVAPPLFIRVLSFHTFVLTLACTAIQLHHFSPTN